MVSKLEETGKKITETIASRSDYVTSISAAMPKRLPPRSRRAAT